MKTTTRTLALKEARGHLLAGARGVESWHRLTPTHWSFRSAAEQEQLVVQHAHLYALLTGHSAHLRVTARPHPVQTWARRLHAATPTPLDGERWADWLIRQQQALVGFGMADTEVYLGVGLGRLRGDRARRRLARLDDSLRRTGLARPVTAAERDWLLIRSVRLGLAEPAEPAALDRLTSDAADALAQTVHVVTTRFGDRLVIADRSTERHVAVLALAQAPELDTAAGVPWLHHAGGLDFPVEWSLRLDVKHGADAKGPLWSRLKVIRDQEREYARFGTDAPEEVGRLLEQARALEDEMKNGQAWERTRAYGHVRAAVAADTSEELDERVDAFVEHYKVREFGFTAPRAQAALAAEFIPGEPTRAPVYLRRLPARYVAAGMPTISSRVGDGRGPRIGLVWGTTRRPVFWDPWHAIEAREESAMCVVNGGLGAGKTALLATVVVPAVMRGATGVVVDPSGGLARLAEHPALAGHVRVLNLTGADPGTLSPYRLIPTPRYADFATDPDPDTAWQQATAEAGLQRQELAGDVLRMLLPPALLRERSTALVLLWAVRRVGGTDGVSLRDVVTSLRSEGEDSNPNPDVVHARHLAGYYEGLADMPLARLLFDRPGAASAVHADVPLTVLTLKGLEVPRPGDETASGRQALAGPLLHTGIFLANRLVAERPRTERKMICVDEAHWLAQWPSGKTLVHRWVRQGRTDKIAPVLATQLPSDLDDLGVAPFVTTWFVGRLQGADAQASACRALGIQPEFAGHFGTLSVPPEPDEAGRVPQYDREFIARFSTGLVERFVNHLADDPDMLRVIAGGSAVASVDLR